MLNFDKIYCSIYNVKWRFFPKKNQSRNKITKLLGEACFLSLPGNITCFSSQNAHKQLL